MTNAKRPLLLLPLLAYLSVFASNCGDEGTSGPPPATAVAALSDDEARTLCQEFITKACAQGIYAPGKPECASCNPCGTANSPDVVRTQCGDGITVGGVRDCIDSGFDMPTCTDPCSMKHGSLG